jgi:tetratricopeptide (TPR) repeat protein
MTTRFIPLKLLRVLLFSAILFLLLESIGMPAVKPAEIVSVRAGAYLTVESTRKNATVGQEVFKGNRIETDAYGRLSLLLPDHALLKISSETRFVYDGVEGNRRSWFLDKGKVWLRGLFKKGPFNVRTPTAVIGVRGTEWYMTVAPDGTTTVGVVDGKVKVENPYGNLFLDSRELALIQPGRAPVKSAYLMPENAVNWTLKYRGLWDQADLERADKGFRPDIRKALTAYHLNDLATAFQLLDRTRPAYGATASWSALAGFLELVSGNDQDARRYFNRATDTDTGWALPVANLALMDLVENRQGPARKEAEKALSLQTGSSVAMIAMAYVMKAELNLERAYQMTQKAVEVSPGFDQALLVSATLALEMEDLKRCRQLLDRISEDAGAAADRATLYGFLSLREGKSKAAEKYFRQAVSLDPEQPDGWMGLGISLFRLNRTRDGLDAMIKAALIAPQISAYQSYLAKAFFEADLIDEAKASLARAKRLDPRDPTPYLYESLWNNEIHRPGEAIRELDKARKLNDNRAVFRSRYLLDQDQAILMGNVSQIYSRLGFDQTSIQRAAQALTINPENQSAHRRLYFALLFDPAHYLQAASTELLLTKLFVPPTRSGVVFDEDSLTPYQDMFERSGADTIVSGSYFQSADQNSETRNPSGTVSLAGQLNTPFAFHTQINLGRNEAETKIDTTGSSNGSTTSTLLKSDQDADIMSFLGFAKWQVTPNVGIFVDGRFRKADTDLSGELRSSMSANGVPFGGSETTSSGNTELKVGDFDGGLNARFFEKTRGLFHVSYNNDAANGNTDQQTDSAYYSANLALNFDQDATEWIVQGTVWQDWADHFFQIGFRHYTKDGTTRSTTEGETFHTEFYQAEDFESTTGFIFHQHSFFDTFDFIWGLTVDQTQYESPSDHKASRTTANPVAGITWDIHPSWRFRTAYLQNMVGDRSERLQPSMIAGFPLLRVSQLDAYTAEQLLQLQHKTFAVGLDYQYAGYPIFAGFEAGYDRANSRSFQPPTSDTVQRIDSEAYNLLFYVETLITEDFSTSLTYRYSDYEFPNAEYENRIDWKAAYFTRIGLTLNLHGIYRNRRPDDDTPGLSTREIWSIEPSIDWYLINNKVRLTLAGHLEEQITDGSVEDNNTFRWIRGAVTLYF